MEENTANKQTKNRQLGFHWYKDASHYDEPSLDYWLPKLKSAGTRWLVVYIPDNCEVPESFIRRLKSARIEPILVLSLSISEPPDTEVFRQRMVFYHKIGVRLVQFFNYPNMRSSWNEEEWVKSGLVKRFIRRYCTYADICVEEKIIPVFPLLEPGGDYWDLSFFETSVRALNKYHADELLPNLVFSANASLCQRPIGWNQLGPERIPFPVPYQKKDLDHRGFYLYEWYDSILQKELKHDVPFVLFNAGQWNTGSGILDHVTKESKKQYVVLLNLVQNIHNVQSKGLPETVISCCVYKMPTVELLREVASASSNDMGDRSGGIYRKPPDDGSHHEHGFDASLFKKESLLKRFGTFIATIPVDLRDGFKSLKPSDVYFLIPEVSKRFSKSRRDVIVQYAKLYRMGYGSSLDEALTARKVMILNDSDLYPVYYLHQLQDRGCNVEIISL